MNMLMKVRIRRKNTSTNPKMLTTSKGFKSFLITLLQFFSQTFDTNFTIFDDNISNNTLVESTLQYILTLS